MSVNHKIVYVPLTKDFQGNDLIYPIYLPVVVNQPEILMASGSLSEDDYERTKEILHVDEEGGFPLAPIIAALAPIVIPGAIKAVKNVIHKIKGSSDNSAKGENEECGYIPTNPNIRNLKQLQQLYEDYS